MKFYPADWRSDKALRLVSLAARGLWMEMLCLMHEASPYGHLVVNGQPVTSDFLARLAGTSTSDVQALLVELQSAGVSRLTRSGIVYSKRMTEDYKRAVNGRKAKLAGLAQAAENNGEKPPPSRVPRRPPSRKRLDARAKVEGGSITPSTLSGASDDERTGGSSPPRAEPIKLVWDEARQAAEAAERSRERQEIHAGLTEMLSKIGGRKP